VTCERRTLAAGVGIRPALIAFGLKTSSLPLGGQQNARECETVCNSRRFAGDTPAGQPLELELDQGSSLQDLIDCLGIPPEETKVAFVNGRAQELDYILESGDEVGIFPPIGGG
jgi:sulfur carrier protein ThiS